MSQLFLLLNVIMNLYINIDEALIASNCSIPVCFCSFYDRAVLH